LNSEPGLPNAFFTDDCVHVLIWNSREGTQKLRLLWAINRFQIRSVEWCQRLTELGPRCHFATKPLAEPHPVQLLCMAEAGILL